MKHLTMPDPKITVEALRDWLNEAVEKGHGDLPVCISYEVQRGQRAVQKATSVVLDQPQRHPAERVIIGTPILG